MTRIAYVNGRYVRHAEAMVHVEDRGYRFANGHPGSASQMIREAFFDIAEKSSI